MKINSKGVAAVISREELCGGVNTPPLVSKRNKLFTLSDFSTALKLSKVYPKHIKELTAEVQNYRAIPLLLTFSKIIEKVVLNRLDTSGATKSHYRVSI